MNEETFNKFKSYMSYCIFWENKPYRLYLSNGQGYLFDYNNYCSLYYVSYCIWKGNDKTDWDDTYTAGNNFLMLDALDNDDLKSYMKKLRLSTTDSKALKEDFEIIFDKFINYNNSSAIEVIVGPCCVCGMNDKWNSVSNGKSYCYNHCKY